MPAWQDRYKDLYPGQISDIKGFQQGTISPFIYGTTPGEQQLQAGAPSLFSSNLLDWNRQATVNAIERGQDVAERMPEGYTPEQQQQITSGAKVATYSPIAASARAAGDALRRQAVMTGSPTALAPALAGFARQRGQDLSTAAGGLSTQLPQMFHEAQVGDLAKKAQLSLMPGELAETARRGEQAGYNQLALAPQLAMQRFGMGTGAWGDEMKNILGISGQLAGLAGQQLGKPGWGDTLRNVAGSWLSRPSK